MNILFNLFSFFFFLNLWWAVPKVRYNGSEVEINRSIGRNRGKYIPVVAIQGWTHSEMTDKFLHCWETPQ